MKIVQSYEAPQDVITFDDAKKKVEQKINNTTKDYIYVVKYEGKIVSFSTEYYKFAWKTIGYLRSALTQKFGRELSEALVENDVIQIIKVYI